MPVVHLHSFTDHDRSGKIRWTAAELGLDVEEHRVVPGEHRKPPYTDKNPYGHIPTVEFDGQVLQESTAICRFLVDTVQKPKLDVDRGEDGRQAYHFWTSVFCETMESRLVESILSKSGIVDERFFELHERALRRKLKVAADMLPTDGYLCGTRFTLADICAGYSLRLAVQTNLLDWADVESYMNRLRMRPAAEASRMFSSLKV